MRRTLILTIVAAALGTLSAAQPQPPYEPRVFAHVCTWLDESAWEQTTTKPLRGPYIAWDPAVMASQLAEMRTAGMAPLVSWTGPDRQAGDRYLNVLVSLPATDVPAAILYEGLARLKPRKDGWIDFEDSFNRDRFTEDMRYLYDRYFSRYPERFMRQDGRFVVLAWPSHIYRGPFRAVGQALMQELPLYLVSTDLLMRPYVRPDAADVIGGFAAVSAYGIYLPEIARELGTTLDTAWLNRWQAMADIWDQWLAANEPQVKIALPLQFAFDDHLVRGDENPVWNTDYTTASELVRRTTDIIDDSTQRAGRYLRWTTCASWSEHFEGSAVEPTDRHGTKLYDAIRYGFARPMQPRHP